LSYLNIYLLCWVAIRAINDLRIRMFEHLMHLPLSFFTRSSTGDLMSRINETAVLQNTITTSVAVIIREPISILALLAMLLVQQPKLTVITLLVLPISIIPIAVYGRKLRKSSHAIQATTSALSTVMHEAFTGTRIIKAYNLESTVIDQFKGSSQFAISQYMRMVRASEIPGPLIEFLGAAGVAMFLLYFAFLADSKTGPADLLQFVISIFLIYPPVKALGRLHSQLELARVAGNRIFQLLETKSNLEEPAQPKPLRASHAAIQFQDIEFSYEKKPVLQNINIAIQPGKLVALVGSSGSGKTTLTNLLLRFYDPQRGSVRIGGIDIREVSLRDLRSQIAVVTQETILFNDTIARNIELGRPGATGQEIESAARHAHAYDFIKGKPGGFNTRIGEKGVVLSGGERQRLSIARAILKNAPILVLDEATSSLDSESERAVQAALEELMQGRTTICIAHRFSTIHNADLIVVMDQGRVVETGKHSELIHRPGIYQKLHALQFP
jgi:subfamily B ATP-binding cassette protein MsbA